MWKIIKVSALFLGLLLLAAGCKHKTANSPVVTDGQVPAKYQDLYTQIQGNLTQYNEYFNSHNSTNKNQPIFGAELLTANSNGLKLSPKTITGVIATLNAYQKIGIAGITIAINYPLYTPDYPHYQDYVAFYKQVVSEVRKRGLKLTIESGPSFNYKFNGLTLDTYFQAKKQMLQTLINDLQPDYLNIGSEPENDAKLLGLPELNSPKTYTDYINYVLKDLNRCTTRVAAGIGTWGSIDFVQNFVTNTSLDDIDLHWYPVKTNYLQTALAAADLAHKYNKGVTMGEVWLFKQGATERINNIAANYEIFKRDSFSFWAPLDQQFLGDMVKFTKLENVSYISPFWTQYFFNYLSYSSELDNLDSTSLTAQVYKAAVPNILSGTFSSTGEYYKNLIKTNK